MNGRCNSVFANLSWAFNYLCHSPWKRSGIFLRLYTFACLLSLAVIKIAYAFHTSTLSAASKVSLRACLRLVRLQLHLHIIAGVPCRFVLLSVSQHTGFCRQSRLQTCNSVLNCVCVLRHDRAVPAFGGLRALVLQLIDLVLVPKIVKAVVGVADCLSVRGIEGCPGRIFLAVVL